MIDQFFRWVHMQAVRFRLWRAARTGITINADRRREWW